MTPAPLVWSDNGTQPTTNPHYDDVIYPGGVLLESDRVRVVSGEHDRNIAEHVFDLPDVMAAMRRVTAASLCISRGRALHPPEVPRDGKAYVRCEGEKSPHRGKPVCQCRECGPQCPAFEPDDDDPTDSPEADDGLTSELRHQIVAVTRPEDAEDGPGLIGWCSTDKAKAMASLIVKYKPETIVEIGVFGGRSLIPMAMACRHNGTGRVYGIDPYDRDAAADSLPPKDAEWWSGVEMERVRKSAEDAVSVGAVAVGGYRG